MPRIRTIKPEFWSSPSVAGADPWVRLLYIAMWNWADDHGRGTANVKELAAFAFPHDDDPDAPTSTELPRMLAEIAGRFSVVFYEADGRRFYAIPSWDTHQRNERRAKSKHPAPDDGTPYNPDPSDQREPTQWQNTPAPSDDEHGTSAHDDGSSGPGTGEQGNRGTGVKETRTARAARPDPHPRFGEFWDAYPLKRDRQDAIRKFTQVVGSGVEPDHLIAAARAYADDPNRSPRYTKHAATWLNKGAYDDAPAEPRGPARAETITGRAVASVDAAFDEYEARQTSNVAQLRQGA